MLCDFGVAPCAVRKGGYFGPVSPNSPGDRNTLCVPMHRTAQILSKSKNSDKAMSHTENAGLLSKSAVFALQTCVSRVVGGLQGGHRQPTVLIGALFKNAPISTRAIFTSQVRHIISSAV